MKLLFKQRVFSWFDSYDIYGEDGETVFTVQGRLSWGHCLEIFGPGGENVGTVKEELLTWTATAGRCGAIGWSGITT